MPLSQLPIDASKHTISNLPLEKTTPPTYLIFFSSTFTEPWCPDCRAALPAIHNVFDSEKSPTAYWLDVNRDDWKNKTPGQEHFFRTQFGVNCLPTIIRWEKGQVTGRLGDDESSDESKLRKLVA
ncbi:unnamed protein product [Sympodiomycopsis kandeliae]